MAKFTRRVAPATKAAPTVPATTGDKSVAAAAGVSAPRNPQGLGPRIEKAMADAYLKAIAAGVTDPQKQKQAMQDARRAVVAENAKATKA